MKTENNLQSEAPQEAQVKTHFRIPSLTHDSSNAFSLGSQHWSYFWRNSRKLCDSFSISKRVTVTLTVTALHLV